MISSRTLAQRVGQVAGALGIPWRERASLADAVTAFAAIAPEPSAESAYLLLAVTAGVVPPPADVVALHRAWRLEGPEHALGLVLRNARGENRFVLGGPRTVRIATEVIVDVHDTSQTSFTTGIQRVVRSTMPWWVSEHAVTPVAWTDGFGAPRSLSAAELDLALGRPAGTTPRRPAAEIVIPFGGVVVLPEIAAERRRATRLRTIAQFSGARTVALGHDVIPVTTAETTGAGMPGVFAKYLAALAVFDQVVATSSSSSTEFAGWRGMLSGGGLPGPEIAVVELPDLPAHPDRPLAAEEVRRTIGVGAEDVIVLAVGSHEPRKNHLALLQAAELAWREGGRFALVLVGGNSWDTVAFERSVADARSRGRRVVTLSAAGDELLWGLYAEAAFTVFPSLNEGFGLPVVESIASGTPVITSDFGSMREIAEGFGGVLVDPRDENALAAAILGLLASPERLARLRAETEVRPRRGWQEYAEALWEHVRP